MLAGQTIQETGGRPGAIPVNNEITCSQCRHWDLEHVQWSEFDDEAIPHREYLARCMNPDSLCWGRFIEAHDGCGAFEQR
jgi:hypothetical protein